MLLGDAVLANGLQDVAFTEAIEEPSIAAADHGLGLAGAMRAGRPCEGEPRSPVGVVADVVLRLVAEAIAQREVGAELVVVLEEEAGVEVVDAGRGGAGSDGVFGRRVGLVGVEGRVDVLAVETRG